MSSEYSQDDLSFGEALLILASLFFIMVVVELGDLAAFARRRAHRAAS